MSEETILTAARRLIRFVRTDDHANGGLLSLDTIRAAETLDEQVAIAVKRAKRPIVFETNHTGPVRCTVHSAQHIVVEPLEKT